MDLVLFVAILEESTASNESLLPSYREDGVEERMREGEREDDEEKYEKRELPQVLRTGKRIKMNECRAAANTP